MLPRLFYLQWFSGNLGFHPVRHLSPRSPNYHLERCHNAEPLAFRLWDEQQGKLVGFGALKKRHPYLKSVIAGGRDKIGGWAGVGLKRAGGWLVR
jgi:hypothetical protein